MTNTPSQPTPSAVTAASVGPVSRQAGTGREPARAHHDAPLHDRQETQDAGNHSFNGHERPAGTIARRRLGSAYGSTGPRTTRGKRRSSLNRLKRGLCPGWILHELRMRGEDPEAFRRLHRDLIGWLGPDEARSRVVEMLAEASWEKLRRVRGW